MNLWNDPLPDQAAYNPLMDSQALGPTVQFGAEAVELALDPATVYGAGWNVPGTATTAPNAARAAYLSQFPSAMTDAEAEYAGRQLQAGAGLVSGGISVSLLATAGMGAAAWWLFRGRRANPRRRLTPLLAVGGGAAVLWWLGQRTVQAAKDAVAARAIDGLFGGASR